MNVILEVMETVVRMVNQTDLLTKEEGKILSKIFNVCINSKVESAAIASKNILTKIKNVFLNEGYWAAVSCVQDIFKCNDIVAKDRLKDLIVCNGWQRDRNKTCIECREKYETSGTRGGKIPAIIVLRGREPDLSLKEAKDQIEWWADNGGWQSLA